MALPPGPLAKLLATTKPSRRLLARPVGWAALAVSLFVGCGEDDSRQKAAYDEAVVAVTRERQTLKNVRAEQQRVYGEYLLNDFEGRLQSGSFSVSGALGLPWAGDYERNPPLHIYLHKKLPLGWFGQLDRLLSDKPEALPWYSRTEGDLHRRRIQERFSRVLNVLHDRIVLQQDRVQKSEEYARLIEPVAKKK